MTAVYLETSALLRMLFQEAHGADRSDSGLFTTGPADEKSGCGPARRASYA
jgi:hypothetical protein